MFNKLILQKSMRIFIIGFMGSGKTTVAKKLAPRLKLSFYDLDKLIEERYNKSIDTIFEDKGEESFRKKENLMLTEISSSDNFILSTGGGLPCFYDNMNMMNSKGKTVYLRMSPLALFSRLKNSKAHRPLIKNLDDGQLKLFIEKKLEEREPYYLRASVIIDALNVDYKRLISEIEKLSK